MTREASEFELQHIALYEYFLRELRSAEGFPIEVPVIPPPIITPATFDELYENRREYQEGRRVFTREPLIQQWYVENYYWNQQIIFQDQTLFDFIVSQTLSENPIVIGPSRFPYELPEGSLHFIMWYRDETTEEQRASELVGLFAGEGVEERDVVLMRNPTHRRSVPAFSHTHTFVRRKPSQTRLKSWFEMLIESGA